MLPTKQTISYAPQGSYCIITDRNKKIGYEIPCITYDSYESSPKTYIRVINALKSKVKWHNFVRIDRFSYQRIAEKYQLFDHEY